MRQRQPLKMADCQARRCPRARQADEMLGGNIRYEQRCADEKPSDIAAGEEVFFRTSFLQGKVQADAEDDGEIDSNDDEIEGCEGSVGCLDKRCKQHPCLLGAGSLNSPRRAFSKELQIFPELALNVPAKTRSLFPANPPMKKAPEDWRLRSL